MPINWNTNERQFKKRNPLEYKRWRLVQLLNYGLWGEKVKQTDIVKNWPFIKNQLDIDVKKTVEFLIWGKKWQGEPGLRPDRSNYLMWLVKTRISGINSTSRAERHLQQFTTTTESHKI